MSHPAKLSTYFVRMGQNLRFFIKADKKNGNILKICTTNKIIYGYTNHHLGCICSFAAFGVASHTYYIYLQSQAWCQVR